MNEECVPRVRPLYAWEEEAGRRVFGDNLDYRPVRIHECTSAPNRINQLGAFMKRVEIPKDSHNAITLGNHIYFPIRMLEEPVPYGHPEHYKICWFIHELTHVWQYQQMGWRYLFLALQAQFRLKAGAYDFGGEQGLIAHHTQGKGLKHFNLEQQGDIARTYYECVMAERNTSAWEPFVKEFKKIA
jgi:hypothetical protein